MTDFIKAWSPILVPLLGLLAGTGWLQYYLNYRRTERENFRTRLEDFLLPLEATLKRTLRTFNKLDEAQGLAALEYHPGKLQHFFGKLPDDDPRKQLWKAYIESLQDENSRAVELIRKFYGGIVLQDFKNACDAFVIHATEWEVMWKALVGSGTIPKSLDRSGTLLSPKFPVEFEQAFQGELAEVRRRAGY